MTSQTPSPLYDGPIIDAHVHYWDPRKTPREVTPLVKLLGWNSSLMNWTARRVFPEAGILFFSSPQYITKPHLPVDYSQEIGTQPVKGVVHIEAGWTGKDPVDETKWLEGLDVSDNDAGEILAIVAHADLSSDNVKEVLKGHLEASSRVKGIRDMIAWHENLMVYNFCSKPEKTRTLEFRQGFQLLSKYNLTFETFLYSTQLNEILELAQEFPSQKILVDHVGTPVAVAGQYGKTAGVGQNDVERELILQQWKADMLKLGRCPNVYCKISGLGMPVFGFGFADKKEQPSVEVLVEKLSPLVLFCIQVFGPQRCMFGSNFPVDKVSIESLDTYITAYKQILARLPTSDQELVFHGTATEFYRLNGEEADEKK